MSLVEVTTISHCRRSGVFIVNFEQILQTVLVFALFTLSKTMPAGNMPIFSHYHTQSDRLQSGVKITIETLEQDVKYVQS